MVVSSAYCDSLISVSPIFIPLMSGFSLMTCERTSAQITKRYGEMGSPCLQPLDKEMFSEKCASFLVDLQADMENLLGSGHLLCHTNT